MLNSNRLLEVHIYLRTELPTTLGTIILGVNKTVNEETKYNLWRGVRSDAQLSCTDTRFQKCSQSGKNGSKHPMLSISMACNVVSCKKSEETLKRSKSLILQCKFSSRAQKWPKIAKKKTITQVWYILGASWWILISRRFRICMAKGGRGCKRPTSTLFSKKRKAQCSWT